MSAGGSEVLVSPQEWVDVGHAQVLQIDRMSCRYTTTRRRPVQDDVAATQEASDIRQTRREQHAIARDLAEEVSGACLGMRVARLHRIVARLYEQALQTVGLSLPQMEILAELIGAAGPVRPAALAARLMLERSTVSRNLALMQKRGWVTVVETSPTGRAMSVTIADTGVAAFTSASTAWRHAQTSAATMLGPAAASMLDQWLDLHAETPASGSDAETLGPRSSARAAETAASKS
jgi:DNA-binding MarR family transcriptional regulator